MSPKKILQIRYRFDGPFGQYDDVLGSFAERMLDVPGLEWKIWLYNEQTGEGSGVYLFADEASARSYAGPMVAEMATFVDDVSSHVYDVHEKATDITNGPV